MLPYLCFLSNCIWFWWTSVMMKASPTCVRYFTMLEKVIPCLSRMERMAQSLLDQQNSQDLRDRWFFMVSRHREIVTRNKGVDYALYVIIQDLLHYTSLFYLWRQGAMAWQARLCFNLIWTLFHCVLCSWPGQLFISG